METIGAFAYNLKAAMAHATEVPITPSVLGWAIDESGYSLEELALSAGVSLAELAEWLSGDSKPSLTQARKLAAKLHRPFAALLLPEPPEKRPLTVEFRHPLEDRGELNPSERRHLRRAARIQEILSWLAKELELDRAQTPRASINDSPEKAAGFVRHLLGIPTASQKKWPNASVAFDEWREALERTGHLVFQFSLGKESCRGFSLWDEFAPVVAVNTAWNESARIFTLFHEIGHLVTRTSSACVEAIRTNPKSDPVERWCERFAAEVLMPIDDVHNVLRNYGWDSTEQLGNLSVAGKIANRYKVSLRAAVIRLIEVNAATWALYDEIPPVSDQKPTGGGGTGRTRTQIREDQYGDRATSLFVNAVERDIISRSQAVDVLDIPDATFDELAKTVRPPR